MFDNKTMTELRLLDAAANNLSNLEIVYSEEGAIETISDFVKTTFVNVSDAFEGVADNISDAFFSKKGIHSHITLARVRKATNDKSFRQYYREYVPVPVSFDTDLLEVTGIVKRYIKTLDSVMYESIEELNTLTAELLSDQRARDSFRPTSFKGYNDKFIKAMTDDLQVIVDDKNLRDRMQIGELLPNLASLEKIASNANDISAAVSYKTVEKSLEGSREIANKIKVFVEYLEDDSNKITMSKQAFKNFTDIVDRTAKGLSLSMQYYTLAMALHDVVNNVVDYIENN